MRTTARIIADVKPSTKEMLKTMSDDSGRTMTVVLTHLIEKEFKRIYKK